jgi:hypothetical protein
MRTVLQVHTDLRISVVSVAGINRARIRRNITNIIGAGTPTRHQKPEGKHPLHHSPAAVVSSEFHELLFLSVC